MEEQKQSLHIDSMKKIKEKDKKNFSLIEWFEETNKKMVMSSALKTKDKVNFFRLFATLMNSGVQITKSLEIIREQVSSAKLQALLDELVFHIKNGSSLSASLMHYPQDFSEAEIGMIKAGETSGKLNITLINIADQLEKSAGITKKIKGAMIYPATIFLVMIVAFFLVMTFVIPQIKDMFDSFDAELPWMTQILIDFSDFLQATDPIFGFKNVINVLILSIILGVSFLVFKKTKRGRILLDYFIFYIPLFGSLVKKMCITKMTRGLSTLLSSGISIVKALKVNSDMIGNEKYKKRILRMAEDVKIGINISDNIKNDYEYFPSMVISMIGVGEQTANLHKITLKIAEMYEEDIDEFVKTLSSIIEPVIIVIVGLAVGFLVIAVMMPILSLSDLAG